MTHIPVDPTQFPLEPEPMDVSLSYKVQITSLKLADKLDKNGNNYLQLETEVLEPVEYQGSKLNRNYIGIPQNLNSSMTEAQLKAAKNAGVSYARFCAAFGLKPDSDGIDLDAAIGNVGMVTISQESYQGRKTFPIRDFHPDS